MKELNRKLQLSSIVSDRFVCAVIIINCIALFIQEGGVKSAIVDAIELLSTLFFIFEMFVKFHLVGFKNYWKNRWNRFDGSIAILSIPAVITYFLQINVSEISLLFALRILRVLKFSRLFHLFPHFEAILKGFKNGLKNSLPIFIGLVLIILMLSLLSCALFRSSAPQYFGTPWDSIYSMFRLFTVEGWYEIPDAMSTTLTTGQIAAVRFYFAIILLFGGIIGLSLVNSIFVDAMVSDNNDELEAEIKFLNRKIDMLAEEMRKQHLNNEKNFR